MRSGFSGLPGGWPGAPPGNARIWRDDRAATAAALLGAPADADGSGTFTDGPIAKGSAGYDRKVCAASALDGCPDPAPVSF